jgi:hypothetical protein
MGDDDFKQEYERTLALGRRALSAQVDQLLGARKREDRDLTAEEKARFYDLVEFCGELDDRLDRIAERRRREDIAAGKRVAPRPPVVVVRPIVIVRHRQARRVRIRRAAAPIARRTRQA